ncbi:MAG TPA: DMT family transporter [Thermohalobaculum sp.]|nr:DMT family transporter [Thermohalobaculum sp.]
MSPSAVLFLAASVWGIYWLPLRWMEAAGLEGAWAVGIFNLLPVPVLAGWIVLSGQAHGPWRIAVAVGLLSGGGMGCYALGLVYSGVVRATMLFYLTPVWGTLIGILWLGERVDWSRWSAIGLGLAGLALLLSGGDGVAMPLNAGDALALASGVLWAGAAAVIRANPGQPLAAMTMHQFLFAGLTGLGFAVLALGSLTPSGGAVLRSLPVAALGSVGMIMPSVLAIFWAQRRVYPGRAGLLMMSEAMVAVVSATLLLPEEIMAPLQWLGAMLIVGACLVEVLATREAARRAAR